MKERTKLTIYRAGIDMPVCVTGGDGERGELRQNPPVFDVTPEEANDVQATLSDPNGILVFDLTGGSKDCIPVRTVAHVRRNDYVPAPTRIDLYQDPKGTLYLARADEDEGLIYRLPVFTTADLGTGSPFADDAYAWCADGDRPDYRGVQECHLSTISGIPAGETVSKDTLTLVAWYRRNVEVVVNDNGQSSASLEARAYIGAAVYISAVEKHRADEPVPLY